MVQVDLKAKFPNMAPIHGTPPLARINGCGTGILGKRDEDAETGAYVTTLCVTLLFIPLLCLRAYRVARAEGGWYFLGREPLSILAKAYNLAVVMAVTALVGGLWWAHYTGSDAYKARQQMASAQALVEQGHLGHAAGIYQQLAQAGGEEADNSMRALKALATEKLGAAPLGEGSAVLSAAAKMTSRADAMTPAEIVKAGMQLIAEKGGTDPHEALQLLNTLRPLAVDTRAIDAARLPLLRKWAADEPGNLEVVVPLAALLEQQNQPAEARKLLLPVKDRLGDGEGARVLGQIYVQDGDFEAAYALLGPYVKVRMEKLHAAEKALDTTYQARWDREIELLKSNKAPQSFYDKYDKATKEQQQALVQNYVNMRIKGDRGIVVAQEAMAREATVVPVALELGIVMLNRAQGQKEPAARQKQLESAEQVFLSIRDFAGESEEYKLYLGQVYYWMGKQTEGRKLFDELLAAQGRSAAALTMLAQRLYDLGAEPDARALSEEAFGKATKPEEKHTAALVRARCNRDFDDEIEWLKKGDVASPHIRARLANVLGIKAYTEGREEEARKHFQEAIDVYATMPRTSGTLNETALAYYSLFQASGEHQALERCMDLIQQAVTLDPSDPTLIFNAAATVSEATCADILAKAIDLRALHQTGNIRMLAQLYNDQAGRDALVRKLKEHPGTARALSYLDKSMVLSPKHARAYAMAYQFQRFLSDLEGLRTLERRAREAQFDTSDQLAELKELVSGEKDAKSAASLAAAVKRSEAQCKELRGRGDRTSAAALVHYASNLIGQDLFTGGTNPAEVVALADEAYRTAPSMTTGNTLIAALLFRANKELRASDPACAALYKKCGRSVGCSYLMVWAANEPGELQKRILQHPDVRRAAELEAAETLRYPDNPSVYSWALLKSTNPAAAERLAELIRRNQRVPVDQAVARLIEPSSTVEALEASWLLEIQGKKGEARQPLQRLAAQGIPMPGQP